MGGSVSGDRVSDMFSWVLWNCGQERSGWNCDRRQGVKDQKTETSKMFEV